MKIKFEFDSSNIIPYLKRKWALLKYWYHGGHKCECCGKPVRFKRYNIEGQVGNKRLMVENLSGLFCPACLYDKIEKYFERSDSVKIEQCDVTGIPAKTISVIFEYDDPIATELGVDLRFGVNWWNGHNVSLAAFEKVLKETGYMKTGSWYGDSMYSDGVVIKKAQSVKEYHD